MKKIFTLFALFFAFFISQAQTTVTVFEKNYAQLAYESFSGFQVLLKGNFYQIYNKSTYNPFYCSIQNTINPNLALINGTQTLYFGTYNNNVGLTIFSGTMGLADLMEGDVIELTVGSDYKIIPVEGLSDAVASDNQTLTFDGTTKYTVTPYTMTVTKTGTVYFKGEGIGESQGYCPITSITVTRELNGQDTFIGYALNGNYGSGLPIKSQTTTTTECNFGFEDVMSLNLKASTEGAYFQNPNIQMSYNTSSWEITDYKGLIELNGAHYMPVYMAPGTYTVSNTNVKAATLWAYSDSSTKVTFKGTDSSEETLTSQVGEYDITNCTEFTVGDGGIYGIFYLSNESNITQVSVGEISDIEWTPELAAGTATDNPFANILSYIQTSANKDINLGLTVTLEPVFTTETEPSAWTEELAMPEWLWNQMKAVEETSGKKIDGYYYTQPQPSISEFGAESSTMQASIVNYSFPCSGVYKLTVESSNEEVVIENGEQEFNVYPSTNLVYNYTLNNKTFNEGLNISGYKVGSDGTIVIDETLTNEQLQNLTLYIPGVYVDAVASSELDNSRIYYLLSDKSTLNAEATLSADDDLSGFTELDEEHTIDLSGLSDTNKYLYVVLAKNQTTAPLAKVSAIIINRGNVPTGIEGINTEVQGEAVYYNLQGVKVANPEKGIFVKVQNGKVTKVVI